MYASLPNTPKLMLPDTSDDKKIIFFKDITGIRKGGTGNRRRGWPGDHTIEIDFKSSDLKTSMHKIEFPDDQRSRDDFYYRLVDAWNTWKIKYAEIY